VCEVLDEKIKSGCSKTSQIEEWSRYFKIERDGNGYIFTEKYDVALKKIDNRGLAEGSRNNNNLYGKYIEKLVLDLLVQKYQITKERKIYSSRDKMLRSLEMVNDNYSFGKFNRAVLGNYINVDTDNIKEFYMLNNRNMLDSVERAFNQLANKCLVSWNIVMTVAIDVSEDDIIILNEDNLSIKKNEEHRTANAEERDTILHMENKVLEEMELESKQDAVLKDRYKEFNDRVCALLRENTKILYYYKSYDVIFHEKVIQELDKINIWILEQEERREIKITLNGIISNNIIENAEHRKLKALETKETLTGDKKERYIEMKTDRRIEDTYVEDNSKIIDAVINCKKKDITKQMIQSNKEDKESRRLGIKKIMDL